MRRVLIALDESPVSLRAARVAHDFFGSDAEFLVINVTRLPVPWVSGGIYGEVWAADPLLWTDQTQEIEHAEREELAAEAADAGLKDAAILVEMGDPADAILDVLAHEDGIIDRHVQLDAGRQEALQARQLVLDVLADGDGVTVRAR